MAPEVLKLKSDENNKIKGNYIKADVYSAALTAIALYYPDISLKKEDRNKEEDEKIDIIRKIMLEEILEQRIK